MRGRLLELGCVLAIAALGCAKRTSSPAPSSEASSPPPPSLPRVSLPEPSTPEEPAFARTVAVEGDLPAFYVAGKKAARSRMVFLHGACTHGLGYIQAFQFTAGARGSLLALQGEHDCGGGFRSWTRDARTVDARIEAAFRAAGDDREGPITAIGYSQGAMVAHELAGRFPQKYRRLVMIGAPRSATASALVRLDGAVMNESVKSLRAVGVPTTFIEIPNARHGQLLDGEVVMAKAFNWLDENARGNEPPKSNEPPNANDAPAPTIASKLAPLGDASWLERLDLGDGDVAFVAVPLGATEPRPLVVGVHGAGDRPEWSCGGWRLGTDAYPFVVCPQGTPLPSGSYAWSSAAQIERITKKSIERTRQRFGAHVAAGPVAYAGFSQGSTTAAPFLSRTSMFRTVLLAEGAYGPTHSVQFAHELTARGVRSVVLVCGTRACFDSASSARPILEKAGLRVFVGGDATSGHNLNREMQVALRRDWATWFEGDPAWSMFPR